MCDDMMCQKDEEFPHIEESAGVFQDELTGVGFVLTVIHVNVELIGLEDTREEEKMFQIFFITEDRSDNSAILS